MDRGGGFGFHSSSAHHYSGTMLQVGGLAPLAPPVVRCRRSPGPSSPVLKAQLLT